MATGSPLSHVVQHPIVQESADLGLFTPEGKITLLSDHIIMILVAGVLLTLFLPPLIRRRKGTNEIDRLVPTGFGNLIEAICNYFRNDIARQALGEHTDRFIKYIWSVFFFVLTINLLGLLPLAAITPTLTGLHIGGTATANIWVTATLALTTLAMMVVNGLRYGGMDYIKHFNPGPHWLIGIILVPVEIIGLVAKAFALAVRLFCNMVAGHLLLAVLLSFIFGAAAAGGAGMGFAIAVPVVIGSVAITMLEIFVAFLQAFIFTFLTTLFIGQSIILHHGDDHGHGDEAHGEAAAH